MSLYRRHFRRTRPSRRYGGRRHFTRKGLGLRKRRK